jgi:hypothetical protein
MLTRATPLLLPVVDLRKWDGPIKNQNSLGSCTGHAFAETGEHIFRKYYGKQPIFSPLYTYALELIADGNFPNDAGSDGTTGCEVVVANGYCEDALYPDAGQNIITPTAAMNANAALWRLTGLGGNGAYHGLTGSQVALSVLGDPVPWPVCMGFTVMASFESATVAETGVYLPQPDEQMVGGHEVKASGYDIGTMATLRPFNCPPAVLFQNSWGADWGLNGYFWCPLSVLDDPNSDLKIIHSGGIWK